MPHESTVAHEQRFQVGDGPVSTRSRASSVQVDNPDNLQSKRPKVRRHTCKTIDIICLFSWL